MTNFTVSLADGDTIHNERYAGNEMDCKTEAQLKVLNEEVEN